MTLKTFKQIQIIAAVIIGITVSQAIVFESFFLPIVTIIVATLVMLILRRRVKEVIADERDYALGGKAALLTLQIFSWLAVVGMLFFYTFRNTNPSYESIAHTLAFSACFLMIVYSLIFRYHDRIKLTNHKTIGTIVIILIAVVLLIAGLRLLSGEDNWICQNGVWVRHGAPSFAAPQSACK